MHSRKSGAAAVYLITPHSVELKGGVTDQVMHLNWQRWQNATRIPTSAQAASSKALPASTGLRAQRPTFSTKSLMSLPTPMNQSRAGTISLGLSIDDI